MAASAVKVLAASAGEPVASTPGELEPTSGVALAEKYAVVKHVAGVTLAAVVLKAVQNVQSPTSVLTMA